MSGGKQRQRPKDNPKGPRSAEKSVESKRRRDLKGAAVNLPNWVIEALARTTPVSSKSVLFGLFSCSVSEAFSFGLLRLSFLPLHQVASL